MKPNSPTAPFHVEFVPSGNGVFTIRISGRLDADSTPDAWRRLAAAFDSDLPREVVVDAANLDYCDGAGIALLLEIQRRVRAGDGTYRLENLDARFQRLLEQFDLHDIENPYERRKRRRRRFNPMIEETGRRAVKTVRDMQKLVAFVGQISIVLPQSLLHPRSVRWGDTLLVAELAGANAVGLVVLLGFLLGLVMSFQAAVPMRQFGVEIFVADLVSLAMVRELGPLITAIILAGRSGSAFAAEIGTMRVNEEVDALKTMGLDPVRFLVVPRTLAAIFVTPLLTLFANLAGLVGGAVVLMSLGYTLIAYTNQAFGRIDLSDLLSGLFKAFVFGILVAAIGCLRGLQTGTGASAVGRSTTSAVVSGIVLIAIADSIFSVVFYYLGI